MTPDGCRIEAERIANPTERAEGRAMRDKPAFGLLPDQSPIVSRDTHMETQNVINGLHQNTSPQLTLGIHGRGV